MKNSITIYHGSISIIKNPKYGKGKPYNDYGSGFYCTESLELAKEWAANIEADGYANKYILDISDLKIFDLTNNASVLNWITILLKNRSFNIKTEIAKRGKKYLIDNFSLDLKEYDVLKGYRADDTYFSYAEGFLNNTISLRQLSEALRIGNLGEQIVLVSKKAFDNLTFIDSDKVDSSIYYPLRMKRNEKARLEYLATKSSEISNSDLFLSDIIRGGYNNDSQL